MYYVALKYKNYVNDFVRKQYNTKYQNHIKYKPA